MNTTHQLTIRGLDDVSKKTLVARARKKGISVNAYSLEILRQGLGTSNVRKTNGLEKYFGILKDEWTPDIDEAIQDQRRTDSRDQKIDKYLDDLEKLQ